MRFVVIWHSGDEGGYGESILPVECASRERLEEYIRETVRIAVRDDHYMFDMLGESVILSDFYTSFSNEVKMPDILTLEEWFADNVEVVK